MQFPQHFENQLLIEIGSREDGRSQLTHAAILLCWHAGQ